MKPSHRASTALASLAAGTLLLTSGCASPQPMYPNATVLVDVNAGQENPEVPLDGHTADALFAYLDTRAGDVLPAFTATPRLGVHGLVVTLDGGTDSTSTVRITTHAIYVTDSLGTVRISDLTGTAFDMVWAAIRPELDHVTVEAIESDE